jgi:hypothetical protein
MWSGIVSKDAQIWWRRLWRFAVRATEPVRRSWLVHPGVGHGEYPVGEELLALRPFRLQGKP